MWVWVDRLGVLSLDAGVSAIVLWAMAALALLGSRQPARRLLIARAATIGSLAFLPLIGFDLVPQYDLLAACERLGLFDHPLIVSRQGEPVADDDEASIDAEPAPLASSPGPEVWGGRILTVFYAVGVSVELGWLALGGLGLARVIARSGDPSPRALALLDSLEFPPERMRPALRVASRVRRPVLVGVLRPLILIPPDLDLPENHDRLRLSLLHELAHAEAGDQWFALLANVAHAFWFFVPPLWWVASQMRLDQEFLADRRAVVGYGQVRDYASSLLELAAARAEVPEPVTRAVDPVETGGSPLFQRVLMLLRCPFPFESRPPVWWSRGLPWLAVLITLCVSTLTVRYPYPAPSGPPRSHTFEMSRLEIPAAPLEANGRSRAVDLPFRLPSSFDLNVEIWGDLPTLARTRIAGLPIDSPRLTQPAPFESAAWHHVRLRRERQSISLSIDGDLASPYPANAELTRWLTVEPAPERPASCRALTVHWSS